MRLKSNSISARLYRYFYGTEIMPTSLCNYFWALVLAYLLIIPLEIFGLVGTLISYKFPSTTITPIFKCVLSFFTFMGCFIIYVMLIPVIHLLKMGNFKEDEIFCGIFIDIILLVTFIFMILLNQLPRKFLVIEYIKSKVKNVCPKIDWDN
jgi:hypothetical protein